MVLAKSEVMTLLDTVQKQQAQFAGLSEQLHLDPTVPITFTKDNRVHIGPKMEMRVVTLGLDNAGKTSILFQLKQNESITTIPTIGESSRGVTSRGKNVRGLYMFSREGILFAINQIELINYSKLTQ